MSYFRDKVPMVLDGKRVIVHLDFNAMKSLGAKYGPFAAKRIHESTQGLDLDTLMEALVAGLERHQPGEYTVESIEAMDPQPAIDPIQDAIFESMLAFQYGAAGPPEPNPLMRLWSRISSPVIRFFKRRMQPIAQD